MSFNESHAPVDEHHCESFRDGDWIIYRCSVCDFELRENWRTGRVQVRNANPHVQHFGGYFPQEYREAFTDLN